MYAPQARAEAEATFPGEIVTMHTHGETNGTPWERWQVLNSRLPGGTGPGVTLYRIGGTWKKR